MELRVEGDKLRAIAPPNAITPELGRCIREHKSAVLDLLRTAHAVTDASPTMPRSPSRLQYPLSATQSRNLYAAQIGPGLPTAFRLRGQLDSEILHAVLKQIVSRHAPLRSIIEIEQDTSGRARTYFQRVLPEISVELSRFDYSTLEPAPRQLEVRKKLDALAAEPFAIATGPLFRFALLTCGVGDYALFVCFSQLAFDGWSFDVFIKELTEGYAALSIGQPWPLPPLEREYADFVTWQQQRLDRVVDEQKQYWKDSLGRQLPAAPIPVDHPRGTGGDYRGGALPFEVAPPLACRLGELARSNGCTMQMIMLTALFVLLRRLGNRPDVVIATPIESRLHPSTEPMIGSFVNLLLLRLELADELSFVDLLTRVRDLCLEAYEHQDTPVDQLDLRVEPRQSTGPLPLWQVEFSYQQVDNRSTFMGAVALSQLDVHPGNTANELSLWVKDWGNRVSGALEFARSLYREQTVQHWGECYQAILAAVCNDPASVLGDLDIVSTSAEAIARARDRALEQPPHWVGELIRRQPDAGAGVRVVDEHARPVPLGVWGTLVIAQHRIEHARLTSDGRFERLEASAASGSIRDSKPRGLSDQVDDSVEFRIIREFETRLDLDGVSLHDNFFDLGGHSLIGVRLLSALHEEFGAMLPLGVLFEAPTPFELARVIRRECGLPDPRTGRLEDGGTRPWTSVVPIQPHGDLPPLFVVAGIGGNPMNLRFVAKHLGAEQPFYGLQHRGTDGQQAPHRSVQAAAREFAAHIREVQPSGPYYVGGFSAGGVAALEIAQVLQDQGEPVGLIVMFDATSPDLAPEVPVKHNRERGSVVRRRLGPAAIGAALRRRLTDFGHRWRLEVLGRLARVFPYRYRMEAVTLSWQIAVESYHLHPIDADVLVLWAKVRDRLTFDETNGWQRWVRSDLRVRHVPGGHTTHVDELNAAETAKQLALALAEARSQPRASANDDSRTYRKPWSAAGSGVRPMSPG